MENLGKQQDLATALSAKASKAPAKSKKETSVAALITAMKPAIKAALPSVITVERFTRMALTAFRSNPNLARCQGESFLAAMMQSAQLGLEPNTPLGQAYLIPYGNQCQFQIGYKGLLDLAYRSGEFQNISAHVVYEHDEFDYEYGLEPKLRHIPALEDRGEVLAYYAVYKLKSGGYGFEVMSKADVEEHKRRFSKAGARSPWATDFDAMALKTVVKKVLKFAPLKVELQQAVTADGAARSVIEPDLASLPSEDLEPLDIDEVTGEVE